MTWDTPNFINGFLAGTLGRKKIHSGWRVLEGSHCRVLVHATTSYGATDGGEVYAMELKAQGERLVFLHPTGTYGQAYQIRRRLETNEYQKIPNEFLRSSDTAILESGIIDLSEHHALIEFGDQPTLMCRKYMEGGAPASTSKGLPKWGSIEPLSKRVATIEEARELARDPEGCEVIAGEWFGRYVDNPGVVPKFEAELSKLLAEGVNPSDYGYEVEDLHVEDVTGDLCLMTVKGSVLENAADKRSISYLAAIAAHYEAAMKFRKYMPAVYDSLSIKADRYSLSASAPTISGRIVATTSGVFVKGLIKSGINHTTESQLEGWYKLEKKVKRKTMS